MTTFTLEEARALLPVLQQMLEEANADLESYWCHLKAANEKYSAAEKAMENLGARFSKQEDLSLLRQARSEFQDAIDTLSAAQNQYLQRIDHWVDRITDSGVILRDLREGLLDFPARQGSLEYFLCWRSGESDISHWHLTTDGFAGRKPLAALLEYY